MDLGKSYLSHIMTLLLMPLVLASCANRLPFAGGAPTAAPAPQELKGDFRVHDPSMIKQGDAYYVFSTGEERGYNSGNIQIRRSTDMATWERIGSVFIVIPAWIGQAIGGTPPNLWAPDISFHNGTYYLYYAGSRFGTNTSVIGLATNTTLDPKSPDYKWVDQGMVLQSVKADNWNAIDPNLAFDAEGTPWLSFGSFWDGIKMRKIDPRTGKLAADDKKLYSLASRGGGPIEAPSIVARNEYYYLFVSFDLCCRGANSTYKIMAGRAKSITGPYIDRDGKRMELGGGTPVLQSHGRYIGPGGQSVYHDDGVYRMVYHYYDANDNGAPKLKISDLTWTDDGWPACCTSE
jgi:arabinan endo-1,5-alpha-L-arabinosidase